MLKSRFGSGLDPLVRRAFPFLARSRISPDALTLLGTATAIGAGAAFALDELLLAAAALVFTGFCDLVDGVVARSQGRSSSAGGFFDSTMDRVSDLAIFGGIALGLAGRADTAGVLLVLWALSGSVVTSYTRARAERHLAHFHVGLMERAERFGVLFLGAVSGFLTAALWVIALGATYTAIQRIVVARRLLRELDRTGIDPTEDAAPPTASEGPAGSSAQ